MHDHCSKVREGSHWLFELDSTLAANEPSAAAVENMLMALVERLGAAFGALAFADERLDVAYTSPYAEQRGSVTAFRRARRFIAAYMLQQGAPLVANRPPPSSWNDARCKLLAAPIILEKARPEGALVLCKPVDLPDFRPADVYSSTHIAALIARVLGARYDSVTGLLLGPALKLLAERVIAFGRAEQQNTLVHVDIDHLGVINQVFGLDSGDDAIALIAAVLQHRCALRRALVGRVAGGTFVAFLPGLDVAEALRWAARVQREVNEVTVGLPSLRITLSVSCGIANVGAGVAFARAMDAAQVACRVAKALGGNRCEVDGGLF